MFCFILQEDDCLAFDFDAAAVVKCYFHTDASYVDNSNPNAYGVDQYVRVSVPCPDDSTTGKYASLFEITKLVLLSNLAAFITFYLTLIVELGNVFFCSVLIPILSILFVICFTVTCLPVFAIVAITT